MKESRPKKCPSCSAPATIHLTQVVNGVAVKLGLCSDCPMAAAVQSEVGWDLLAKEDGAATPRLGEGSDRACPSCGLSPADFKDLGRLGCARCYDTYAHNLESVLGRLQRGRSHLGKIPASSARRPDPAKVAALRIRLREHVRREEYEHAASIRDQLRALEP